MFVKATLTGMVEVPAPALKCAECGGAMLVGWLGDLVEGVLEVVPCKCLSDKVTNLEEKINDLKDELSGAEEEHAKKEAELKDELKIALDCQRGAEHERDEAIAAYSKLRDDAAVFQ